MSNTRSTIFARYRFRAVPINDDQNRWWPWFSFNDIRGIKAANGH